jgi:hypothetical protein
MVVDEIETLHETTKILHEMERLLPSLNTDEYTKNISKFSDLNSLYTRSSVKISEREEVKVVDSRREMLESLLCEEQREMN